MEIEMNGVRKGTAGSQQTVFFNFGPSEYFPTFFSPEVSILFLVHLLEKEQYSGRYSGLDKKQSKV